MYTPLTLGISKLSRFQGRPQISQLGSGAGSDGSSYEHQRTTRTGGKALKIRQLVIGALNFFAKLQWFNALFDDFDVNVACFLKRFPVQDISASMGIFSRTRSLALEKLLAQSSPETSTIQPKTKILFALQVVTRFPGAAAAGELRKVFLFSAVRGSWEFRRGRGSNPSSSLRVEVRDEVLGDAFQHRNLESNLLSVDELVISPGIWDSFCAALWKSQPYDALASRK